MQWSDGPTAGFSTCVPDKLYFPVDTENGKLTVESQQKDGKSMLNYVRSLIKIRHSSSALNNDGDWRLLSDANKPYPMVYSRTDGTDTYVVALNPGEKAVSASVPALGGHAKIVSLSGKAKYSNGKKTDLIKMNGMSAVVFKIVK
jgi:maltose alpha-D-glucosyltransferase/alpha-amylase